jgi:hypothetical protein
LTSLNITQLDLHAQSSSQWDNGNLIGLASNYTTSDGASHGMADVWFATETVAQKPELAAASSHTPPALSMADAIASFQAENGALQSAENGMDVRQPTQNLSVPAMGASVSGMVDAMKQFATDGQARPVLSVAVSVQTTNTLTTPNTPKPGSDLLASR